MQANGADFSRIRVVQVAAQAKEGLVLTGGADATTGSLTAQGPAFEARGHRIDVLAFSDWGVDPISHVMAAHARTLRESPELVRGFVRASVRRLEAARQSPRDAVAARSSKDLEGFIQGIESPGRWIHHM